MTTGGEQNTSAADLGMDLPMGAAMFDDVNLTNIPYMGVLHTPPIWEIAVKSTVVAIMILVALLGNSLVVYIVARDRRMHTTTNYFLVNLAVSDLMVTLSCSWVHLVDDLTEGWVLGAFFCKFNSFSQGQSEIYLPFPDNRFLSHT